MAGLRTRVLAGIRAIPATASRLAHPRSWPVRWRLASVSAGLTLVILVLFGAAIGTLATQKIRSDFDSEVRSAARILASEIRIGLNAVGELTVTKSPQLDAFVLPDDASIRVFDINGNLVGRSEGSVPLGEPRPGFTNFEGMRVDTEEIGAGGGFPGFVQYGRGLDHVQETTNRVWLLILGGILAGTLLASFAGVAVAGRAMRPIAALTATAREVASTGDPSRKMPGPVHDDEVGELAETLEQMLRSLDAARAEREGAMQRQREFVADASHELRTPLTSILANLELLQASLDRASQAEDREVVDSALRSSRRMSRLVGDLLLLARADAGRLGRHGRCDLAEIAGAAAAEAAPLLGERPLSIDNERAVRVEGNPDELHRMVLNLLDNAAHHTPPGTHVELRLRESDGEAVIEVADDGPGIPAEMRGQIFERFVRGEGPADTNGAGGGTGLGLAIVHAVAGSHGGSVEALESESGGALFRARIPLAPRETARDDVLETL